MLIIGIDPGLSGALAALDAAGGLRVVDMPALEIVRNGKRKREVDAALLADAIEDLVGGQPAEVVVEQVGAMPGQGVSSMFGFGQSFGIVLGVLAALRLPVTRVPPATWSKAMGVGKGPDAGRRRASELMPQHASLWARKKDDGRADATLIALFGARSRERAAA